jgi:hypothetical protein
MIFHHRGHVCQKSARAFHGFVGADLPVGSLDSPSACFHWTQPRRQFRYEARLLCYFRPYSNLMQSYQVLYGGFEDLVELTASLFRISPDKARWLVKRLVEYIAGSSDNPRPYPQDLSPEPVFNPGNPSRPELPCSHNIPTYSAPNRSQWPNPPRP